MVDTVPIKILVVDDSDMVRRSLGLFLNSYEDFQMVGEAANGIEAIDFCRQHQPDVILMDIKMPLMNGVEATRIIRQRWPDTGILVMSSMHDEGLIQHVLDAGANSFLHKTSSIDQMAQAIQQLTNGTGNSRSGRDYL